MAETTHDEVPESYRPGYERAAQSILEYIAAQDLRPGDRMPTEAELGEHIGASRAITREALKVLSAIGRVQILKRRGIFVAESSGLNIVGGISFLPGDLDHVDQFFEYRLAIEVESARLAAERARPAEMSAVSQAAAASVVAAEQSDFVAFRNEDEAFHLAVAVGSHNLFVHRTVEELMMQKRQVLTIGLGGHASGPLDIAARQHVEIAEAIGRGDGEAASERMREHVQRAHQQFRRYVTQWMRGLVVSDEEALPALEALPAPK